MPLRSKLYLLLLRAAIALLPVALLVLFFFSSRIVGWLPQSTVFVVVFVFTAVALIVWMSGIAGQRGAAEREIYLRRQATCGVGAAEAAARIAGRPGVRRWLARVFTDGLRTCL